MLDEQDVMTVINKASDRLDLSLDYLKGITGNYELSDSYVDSHIDSLEKSYKDTAGFYGFLSFYDMYLYCRYCQDFNQLVKSASKHKDLSKMRLMQRTVIRRGKPTTLSFYESVDKKSSSDSDDNQSEDNVQQANGIFTAGSQFGKPDVSVLSNSLPPKTWLKHGKYKTSYYDYMFYVQNNIIISVIGISKIKGCYSMDYIGGQDEETINREIPVFVNRLLKQAWTDKRGVILPLDVVDSYKGIDDLCAINMLKKHAKSYQIDDKELVEALGDSI